jgi:hypothetical protein
LPSIAAASVLGVVVVAGISGARGGDAGTSSSTLVPSSSAAATTTVAPVVVVTDPAVQKTQLAGTIAKGSSGEDVRQVQQRLTDLGFAPGPIDGQFGNGTQQAVWAYEKYVLGTPRANATGQVTNEMWQAMQDNITIGPRRVNGAGSRHMEIYLPEQVAIVFHADKPVLIAHISSGELTADGKPDEFCEKVTYDTDKNGKPLEEPIEEYICALSKTPGGVFEFERKYEGLRRGPLGGMQNPVYFNYGIAVHGADNVPLEPVSHGCVRLNQTIAKTFQQLVEVGDRVYVWGHDGKEPEQYGEDERLPSFNYRDPNAPTTTSTTSTTTTTVVTSTTKPPSTTTGTTAPPATTTTVATTSTTTTTVAPPTSG